jgi:hypothetical protein
MIFIFDWGHTTARNIGPLSADDAEFEIEAEFVFLIEQKTWFRFFFIPTIVTERKYFFKDADSERLQPISKEVFNKYRSLANLNMQSMNDEISEEEYQKKREEL